jgi:hypothetical protein
MAMQGKTRLYCGTMEVGGMVGEDGTGYRVLYYKGKRKTYLIAAAPTRDYASSEPRLVCVLTSCMLCYNSCPEET